MIDPILELEQRLTTAQLLAALEKRGYTAERISELQSKLEARVARHLKKPCPSKTKYRGEVLECQDVEGHNACHYHLNVIWPNK